MTLKNLRIKTKLLLLVSLLGVPRLHELLDELSLVRELGARLGA